MTAHRCGFALALLAALTTSAAGADGNNAPAPIPPIPVEEVVVAAPEPRYVAPTLRDHIGRVWAPVYINGRGPFRLVLDTGANRSAVIASLASRIGVPLEQGAMRVHGVTGTALVSGIRVDSIEVGDLRLGNQQVAVVPDVFGGAEGVLGANGLGDKMISIDFLNDRISIRRSRPGAVPSGYTRVPARLRHGHLLMFEVKIAGVRTKAMLDTGAQATIGNRSLQAALARRARNGEIASLMGVTLDLQQGEMIAAPPVTIADIMIRGMRVTFGDMYIFEALELTREPVLLIGMDVIGLLDSLIIDYRRRELHLRARN